MFRAFFLAIGIFACIVGGECLAMEKAVLRTQSAEPTFMERTLGQTPIGRREIAPPPWAPWSLMAGGAVTILYSFTIPRRVKE